MASPFFYKRGQFFNTACRVAKPIKLPISLALYIRRSEAQSQRIQCTKSHRYHEVKNLEKLTIDNWYTLPDLPYDYAALKPHYSARLLEAAP